MVRKVPLFRGLCAVLGVFMVCTGSHGAAAQCVSCPTDGVGALSLDGGSAEHIALGTDTALHLGGGQPFSIATWVNLATYSTSYYSAVYSTRTFGITTGGLFSINGALFSPAGALSLDTGRNDGAGSRSISSPASDVVAREEWTHIAATYRPGSGDNNKATLYINGAEVATTESLNAFSREASDVAAIIGWEYPDSANSVLENQLEAMLDEFAVFNQFLDNAQIDALYTTGSTCARTMWPYESTVLWLRFEEEAAGHSVVARTTTTDSSRRFELAHAAGSAFDVPALVNTNSPWTTRSNSCSQCPSGAVPGPVDGNCLVCDAACDGCSAAGNTNCQACSQGYFATATACLQCFEGCEACTGPLSKDCIGLDGGDPTCAAGFTWHTDVFRCCAFACRPGEARVNGTCDCRSESEGLIDYRVVPHAGEGDCFRGSVPIATVSPVLDELAQAAGETFLAFANLIHNDNLISPARFALSADGGTIFQAKGGIGEFNDGFDVELQLEGVDTTSVDTEFTGTWPLSLSCPASASGDSVNVTTIATLLNLAASDIDQTAQDELARFVASELGTTGVTLQSVKVHDTTGATVTFHANVPSAAITPTPPGDSLRVDITVDAVGRGADEPSRTVAYRALARAISRSVGSCCTVTPTVRLVAPTVEPRSGQSVRDDLVVHAASNTAGATLRYTDDGSSPTSSSAVFPDAGLTLAPRSAEYTIKVAAFEVGQTASPVTTRVYLVHPLLV